MRSRPRIVSQARESCQRAAPARGGRGSPGFDDIVSGSTVFHGGLLTVHSGATNAVLKSVRGGFGDELASSVARAGDSDADGILEFLVGVPGAGASKGAHRPS